MALHAHKDHCRLTSTLTFAIFLVLLGLLCLITHVAVAHEHTDGATQAQKRVVDFLRSWRRPRGNYSGIAHRTQSCCYVAGPSQDCFAVLQARRVNGILEVFPDSEGHPAYDFWYKVNTGVDEDLQEDPRESPDGRSYVCIQGQQVVCYVGGSGG